MKETEYVVVPESETETLVIPEEAEYEAVVVMPDVDEPEVIVQDHIIESTVVPEVPQVLSNEQIYVYVPTGSTTTKGIVKFNGDMFVVIDGEVFAKIATTTTRGIAKFNSLNFEVTDGDVTIKKATNERFGIIKGTYARGSSDNFMVDISDGEIVGIYVKTVQQLTSESHLRLNQYLNLIETKLSHVLTSSVISVNGETGDVVITPAKIGTLTEEQINTIKVNLQEQITTNKNNIETLDGRISDIEDVIPTFITKSVDNLVNYYKKSETYTQSEVNQLVSTIPKLHFEVVQQLPAVGDENIIYLVPSSKAEDGNSYEEYIYINNKFELIGTTKIDLTGYATETWVNNQIKDFLTETQVNALITTALNNYYTIQDIDGMYDNLLENINKKQDTITDLQDIRSKANSALQPKDNITELTNDAGYTKVESSTTNGNIKINDNETVVYNDTNIKSDITDLQNNKVDKVDGKQLSTNDFTNDYKSQVEANTAARHTHTNKAILDTITETSINSWNDKVSQTQLTTELNKKQDTLISGTNIKTLNNESLLGEGNIDITSAQWGNITGDLNNQTDLKNALNEKANNSNVESLTTQVNANTTNISTNTESITNLQTSKLDASKANTNVMTDLGITAQNDNVSLNKNYKNLSTQETSSYSVNVPLANDTTAGLMSKADYKQIRDNTARIKQLEGQNIRLLYTASDNPTASQIEAFVKAEGYTDTTQWSQIGVVVSGTNHIWRYYTNTTTWTDIGVDTVNQFTNSIAGIIKGSATNGKVYAETDGTGSVYGWDDLNTKVTNNTSAIGTETTNRTSADETLQSNINTVSSNLSNEITNRQTADTNLQTQITTNATNISNKMDKTNPTGSGSFKLNASSGTVGTNSVSINGLASGMYSTTLGTGGRATEYCSYCEGHSNQSSGTSSHAEGEGNKVTGNNSHVEGFANTVNGECQHVFGKANIIDNDNKYVEIVGNGNAHIRDGILYVNSRSNARTLDWNGNEYIKGNLQASGLTDGTTTKTMSEILAGGGGMKLWRYED